MHSLLWISTVQYRVQYVCMFKTCGIVKTLPHQGPVRERPDS